MNLVIQQLKLGRQDRIKEFNQDIGFEREVEEGWEVEYYKGEVRNVFLFGGHDKKFKSFKGALPYGLKMTHTNDVVKK